VDEAGYSSRSKLLFALFNCETESDRAGERAKSKHDGRAKWRNAASNAEETLDLLRESSSALIA